MDVAGQSQVIPLNRLVEVWDNTLVTSILRRAFYGKYLCSSIIDSFSELPGQRILLKTQHKLVDIVTMRLCAVTTGADDWVEIAGYVTAKEAWFRGFLELPGGIPSRDTFGRVFALLDPDAFGFKVQIFFQSWERFLLCIRLARITAWFPRMWG
jgi:hypothetical protein